VREEVWSGSGLGGVLERKTGALGLGRSGLLSLSLSLSLCLCLCLCLSRAPRRWLENRRRYTPRRSRMCALTAP
jgi:hypothetical protein